MQPSPASTTEPKLRFGRYTLISEIARGTFGRLWTAYSRNDAGEAEPVLIRRLSKQPHFDQSALEELHRAAEAAASVKGPHVARVIGTEQTDDELGIVFEYAEGKDLRSLLSLAPLKHIRIPSGVALRIATSSLAALAELAHELPEEFRTAALWPDSVFVRADGSICLLDVAVAAAIARTPLPGKTGQLIGYCAPEEFDGGRLGRTDVFRAGILLWEMLSGKRLFSGHTVKATIDQVLKAPIPAIEWLEPDPSQAKIEAVIARALHREPPRRYLDVTDFTAAIADCGVALATDAEVAAHMTELVATGLAAQQRAVQTALASAPQEPEQRASHSPKPEPKPAPKPELETEPEQQAVTKPTPAVAFPQLKGLSATGTLIGVPEPGVLPARRALPPPPRRVLAPMIASAPLDVPSLDDIEAPLAGPTPPPITEDSAITLIDELDSIKLEAEKTEPLPEVEETVPLPEPEPVVAPSPPSRGPITELMALSERAVAAEVSADEPAEASETSAQSHRAPIKRSYLVGAAVALGVLLLGAAVLAWSKSRDNAAAEAATTASAATAVASEIETAPLVASAAAPAESAVEAPAPSASAAVAETDAVDAAVPTADAAVQPAPKLASVGSAPRTLTAQEKSAAAAKKREADKKAAAAKKKKAADKAKKKKTATTTTKKTVAKAKTK